MAIEPASSWERFMSDARERVSAGVPLETRGTLTRLTGLVLEAAGIRVPVGSQCMVLMPGHTPVLAEVVGFSADKAFLMPAGDIHGLSSGASVTPAAPYIPPPRLGEVAKPVARAGVLRLPMGDGLLGRVVDAQGLPLAHARGPGQVGGRVGAPVADKGQNGGFKILVHAILLTPGHGSWLRRRPRPASAGPAAGRAFRRFR